MNNEEYYMGIAIAVREKANCTGRKVGAIVVRDNRIISTGYNGTPSGMTNCLDGGCHRCANPDQYKPGAGYDLCICVHAEQNAILTSARFGISTTGGTVYSTLRPCFNCTKAMLQAKIRRVVYLHDWTHPDRQIHEQYVGLQKNFVDGILHLPIDDPRADWANNKK